MSIEENIVPKKSGGENVVPKKPGDENEESEWLKENRAEYLGMTEKEAEERYLSISSAFMAVFPEVLPDIDKELDRKMANEEISIQEACLILKDKELKCVANREKGHFDLIGRRVREKFIEDPKIKDILMSQADSKRFLGNGSIAEVFRLIGYDGVCVKIVKNFIEYNNLLSSREGNSVSGEARFLEMLDKMMDDEKIKETGVRTPVFYYTYDSYYDKGIVMEELDAVNLRRVVEGHDELPESFEFKPFFEKLEKFILVLHDKGIYHRDYVLRNFMVDRKTGSPYVIDFGKAKEKSDVMHDVGLMDAYKEKDMSGLEQAMADMKRYMIENGKII